MFEDATFDSGHRLHSQTPRWLLTAVGVNLCLLAAMIVQPLIFPEGLPAHLLSNLMDVPVPPAMGHSVKTDRVDAVSRPVAVPTTVPATPPLTQPLIRRVPQGGEDAAPTIGTGIGNDDGGQRDGVVSGLTTDVFRPTFPPQVKPAVAHSVRLASTITTGLVVSRTTPVYPSIAKATGTSGTVVLAATISTTGTIENLRVVSGPPMLRQAAIDAVKTWRYRPYLLNNEPVEVETTVNVVFSLGRN